MPAREAIQHEPCEICGAPYDKTTTGSMPRSWSPGPIRWLCERCAPAAYAEHETRRDTLTALPQKALELLLNESEWATENWTGSENGGHTLECLTCGASFGNAVADDPIVKHKPDCKRETFFNEARRVGLLPPKTTRRSRP